MATIRYCPKYGYKIYGAEKVCPSRKAHPEQFKKCRDCNLPVPDSQEAMDNPGVALAEVQEAPPDALEAGEMLPGPHATDDVEIQKACDRIARRITPSASLLGQGERECPSCGEMIPVSRMTCPPCHEYVTRELVRRDKGTKRDWSPPKEIQKEEPEEKPRAERKPGRQPGEIHPELLPEGSHAELKVVFPLVGATGRRRVVPESLRAFRKRYWMNKSLVARIFGISERNYRTIEAGDGSLSPQFSRQLEMVLSTLEKGNEPPK